MMKLTHIVIALLLGTLLCACATSGNAPPTTTDDGLVLDSDAKAATVYKKPGASLAGYEKFGLVPCQVAFRKDWQRDQNMDNVDPAGRITQKDVDRITGALSAECDKYFRAALTQPPPYTLVEEFEPGDKVLVLRPNIVNLDIAAPDKMTPGISRTFTTSSGSMTLYLELLDGSSKEVLARIIDRKDAPDEGRLQWSNSVTNKADADRILRYWTSRLRTALDSAQGR